MALKMLLDASVTKMTSTKTVLFANYHTGPSNNARRPLSTTIHLIIPAMSCEHLCNLEADLLSSSSVTSCSV
jgi:hypothetical protein